MSHSALIAPAFIRGKTITDALVTFSGRGDGITFQTPDPKTIITRLAITNAEGMTDIQQLSFEEILGYLEEIGNHLALADNDFMQEALEQSRETADMTMPIMQWTFEQIPSQFMPDTVREMADFTVGIPYLKGWVDHQMNDGRVASIRAFGARSVHIIAGNSPMVAAMTIVRNAITRSDAIIKTPSNDPLTALAIARTMEKVAPDHPITKHVSVAYWKGGDIEIEELLYQPSTIDKIIAWGGLASVKHVTRYIQPGIELVTLDPKRSATVIGPEAFKSDEVMRDVARRAASDVGALNQLGCVCARVIYVASGTDDTGLGKANKFGQMVYDEILKLPGHISTKPKRYDPELRAEVDGLRTSGDWYKVIGGRDGEGAVIVSQTENPVDFHRSLTGRTANIVPIDDPMDTVKEMNAYTQTIGIYPESLKLTLRDILPRHGAQRLVTLGYAAHGNTALPQDAIEPVRRMVKWIVDETCDSAKVPPLWEHPSAGIQKIAV